MSAAVARASDVGSGEAPPPLGAAVTEALDGETRRVPAWLDRHRLFAALRRASPADVVQQVQRLAASEEPVHRMAARIFLGNALTRWMGPDSVNQFIVQAHDQGVRSISIVAYQGIHAGDVFTPPWDLRIEAYPSGEPETERSLIRFIETVPPYGSPTAQALQGQAAAEEHARRIANSIRAGLPGVVLAGRVEQFVGWTKSIDKPLDL